MTTPYDTGAHEAGSAARAAIPRVLSIAGTDPTGGAGIQADLKSIAANGGYGMAVVTSLVAQNTGGVRSIHTPPVAFLREQLDAVSDDVIIDAVKIGMLFDVATIEAVRAWLERVRPPLVVLDPVMVAASGDRLLSADAEDAMRGLLAAVDLATPNIAELGVLAGEPAAADWAGVLRQAQLVSSRHQLLVLAKGGHLESESAPDALVDVAADEPVVEFPGSRIATRNTHGTGCSLSSSVATWRARTGSWTEAVGRAKAWLTESIRHADELHVGSGYGPVSHFAGLWRRGGIETPPAPATVADEWWDAIEDTRTAIDTCAFVRGLGDGTLDPAAFGWYLTQDAVYLRGYARALAAAGTLAPTPDEQAFWADAAHQTIVTELQLHEGRLGPAADVDAEPAPVTARYLAHLLAPVAVGDYPTLVAGVLPCFWLYQDAGTRLRDRARPGHPYTDWLATYDDPAFAEATRRAIQIVTATAARVDERTRATMRTAFVTAAQFELAFFEAPLGITSPTLVEPAER